MVDGRLEDDEDGGRIGGGGALIPSLFWDLSVWWGEEAAIGDSIAAAAAAAAAVPSFLRDFDDGPPAEAVDERFGEEEAAAGVGIGADPPEGKISTALKMLPLDVTRDSLMMKTPPP